jgi:hypothetical protein
MMNRQAGFVLLAQWLIVRRYPKLDGLVQIGEGIKFLTLHFSAKHLRGTSRTDRLSCGQRYQIRPVLFAG